MNTIKIWDRAKRPSKPDPTKPPYLRCPACGHVDRTAFWVGRKWKCVTAACGEVTEGNLVAADVTEFRAYLNREDEQPG